MTETAHPEPQTESHLPDFCDPDYNSSQIVTSTEVQTLKLIFYSYATMPILVVGILGQLLNLVTLQAKTLQSVPFMYIRAIGVFDLIALCLVFPPSARIGGLLPRGSYRLSLWQAHFELPILNTFMVASLYSAVVLTMERYLMICRPTRALHGHNHRLLAKVYILLVCVASALMQLPGSLRFSVADHNGSFSIEENRNVLCVTPWAKTFKMYTYGRECIRFLGVALLAVLNFVIVIELRKANRRKALLKSHSTSGTSTGRSPRSERSKMSVSSTSDSAIVRSYTESKVTVLMIVIATLYILGNLPMAVNMLVFRTSKANDYYFELFRAAANLMEVLHHCLNFYVFCVASSDYSDAFLANCHPARRLLCKCCPTDCMGSMRRSLRSHLLGSNDGPTICEGTSLTLTTNNSNQSRFAARNTPVKDMPNENDLAHGQGNVQVHVQALGNQPILAQPNSIRTISLASSEDDEEYRSIIATPEVIIRTKHYNEDEDLVYL